MGETFQRFSREVNSYKYLFIDKYEITSVLQQWK